MGRRDLTWISKFRAPRTSFGSWQHCASPLFARPPFSAAAGALPFVYRIPASVRGKVSRGCPISRVEVTLFCCCKKRPFGWPAAYCWVLLGLLVTVPEAVIATAVAGEAPIALRFIGEATLPGGYRFGGTEVGGLSGIDYDSKRDLYYAISDDRSEIDPARFYKLRIDLSDGRLEEGDVRFLDAVTILSRKGEAFAPGRVDPEAIRYNQRRNSLFWSSEGNVAAGFLPVVREMRLNGRFLRDLEVPEKFKPAFRPRIGIRNNLGFESLSLRGSGRLLVAIENALAQDGPVASVRTGSPARLLRFKATSGQVLQEFVYLTEPVAAKPDPPDSFKTSGLVEILQYDWKSFLALERSFSIGVGFTIKIFLAKMNRASDVQHVFSLKGQDFDRVRKRLIFNFKRLRRPLGNVEGMTYGPRLTSGERTLVLVSDNNFQESQPTRILAFAIEED